MYIMFSLFAEIDIHSGISRNGTVPWNYPECAVFFTSIIKDNVVIMGRKTWDLLPVKPLPNCFNVVLTNKCIMLDDDKPHLILSSVNDCLYYFADNYKSKQKIIIGGKSIYEQFLSLNLVHILYITHIKRNYDCDEFLPLNIVSNTECIVKRSINPEISFNKYNTHNVEECAILDTMQYIITHGNTKLDRTNIGTLSIFSKEFRFDISKYNIPMCTTRPLSLRIIFEELMWILRGQTDNNILNDKDIHIWDGNSKSTNGDIGASYGFQMRHYGDEYKDCKSKYSGFDQLNYVINLLKNNPESRRILINLWNPSQLNQMTLPPCLYGYQFYVSNGILSGKLIQRSSDIALAGLHNCASGALFIFMLCEITGLKPGELIWSPSDIHIYMNQIDAVKSQVNRPAMPFPILHILKKPKNNDILNFEYDHFKLLNYYPHKKIYIPFNI